MGYLYDPDRKVYINENLCDENGYYDADALNEMSSEYMQSKVDKAVKSADRNHRKAEVSGHASSKYKAKGNEKMAKAYDDKRWKHYDKENKRFDQATKFADYCDNKSTNESAFLSNIVFK